MLNCDSQRVGIQNAAYTLVQAMYIQASTCRIHLLLKTLK